MKRRVTILTLALVGLAAWATAESRDLTQLILCRWINDYKTAAKAAAAIQDVNELSDSGATALHYFAFWPTFKTNGADVIGSKILLDRGAKLDIKAKIDAKDTNHAVTDGDTALLTACRYGNSPLVAMFLDKGASFQLTDKNGDAPLMLAAKAGDAKSIELLIGKGAPLNVIDAKGRSPVAACIDSYIAGIEKSLTKPGFLEWRIPPLEVAKRYGDTISNLILKDKNAKLSSGSGNPPLARIIDLRNRLRKAVREIEAKNEKLAKDGARTIDTRWHEDSITGTQRILWELVRNGAEIDIQVEGHPILNWALENGELAILLALLERDFDLNRADANGLTPAHHAAKAGMMSVVRKMAAKGANLEAKTTASITGHNPYKNHPIIAALMGGVTVGTAPAGSTVKEVYLNTGLTFKKIPTRHEFNWYLGMGNAAKVSELAKQNKGLVQTSLPEAVTSGDLEMIKLLLENGADPVGLPDKYTKYPVLIAAAFFGPLEVVELFLEKGAKVDARTAAAYKYTTDHTALFAAIEGGQVEIVRALVSRKADVKSSMKLGLGDLANSTPEKSAAAMAAMQNGTYKAPEQFSGTPLAFCKKLGTVTGEKGKKELSPVYQEIADILIEAGAK